LKESSNMSKYKNDVHFLTNPITFQQQDTTLVSKGGHANDTISVIKPKPVADTLVRKLQVIDFSAVDSIFRASERRDSAIIMEQQAPKVFYRRKLDTTEILYKQFGIAKFPIKENIESDLYNENFLYHFNQVKPKDKNELSVFIEESAQVKQNTETTIRTRENTNIKPLQFTEKADFDWITMLLILSFVFLGWIRLFNRNYFTALFKSVFSNSDSAAFYREKNALTTRSSFLLNLFFNINSALFVVLLNQIFQIFASDSISLFAITFGSLVGLYIFRGLNGAFIGYVFLKQKVFEEYFYNVNLFTKITGFVLFPLNVALRFAPYSYQNIIIYTGLIVIVLFYFLLIVRAFQLIIRKNTSLFYMILYLCAFEFAPFLIIYKLLLSFV